jgi:hypothetical protein
MTNVTEVTILLPEAEAKKWVIFQQYYDTFSLIVDRGVFDIRNGSATLHFDNNGLLNSVVRNDFLYSRKHEAY